MERWFSKAFRATPELTGWRNMLTRTPAEGYIGCSAAISGTDFYTPTAGAHPADASLSSGQRMARRRPTWSAKPPIW